MLLLLPTVFVSTGFLFNHSVDSLIYYWTTCCLALISASLGRLSHLFLSITTESVSNWSSCSDSLRFPRCHSYSLSGISFIESIVVHMKVLVVRRTEFDELCEDRQLASCHLNWIMSCKCLALFLSWHPSTVIETGFRGGNFLNVERLVVETCWTSIINLASCLVANEINHLQRLLTVPTMLLYGDVTQKADEIPYVAQYSVRHSQMYVSSA